MHNEIQFQTEVEVGFNLPSAHASKLDHMVAVATLVCGAACAAVLAVSIFG